MGENMFCMKAHQPSIVLPSTSRLVQFEFILATRRPVFSLVLCVIFPELLTSGQLYYSDICNDFIRSLYYFWNILKALKTHYLSLIHILKFNDFGSKFTIVSLLQVCPPMVLCTI